MSKINLLPWREDLRKEKQKDFVTTLGFFILVTALLIGIAHFYNNELIDKQQIRNNYLVEKTAVLDKKIKEIQDLEKEKQRLLDRMRAIEQLQGNRPLIVRFFDELVTSLPDGVSVTGISQKGLNITINGEAQSNARVSSLMRNLEASEWLEDPQLDIIQTKDASGLKVSQFILRFNQVIPGAEEGEK